ncbi:TniQ family protein [Limimaricola variabilis]
MSVLFPHLPFDPIETPISFATRLANFHLGSNVAPFLNGLGISPQSLLAGEAGTVEQLAEIANVDGQALRRNSACRVGTRRFDLRGNMVSAEFFNPDTVFCAACLLADDSCNDCTRGRRGKLIWTLKPVRTCPLHGLALVRRKAERWDDKYHEMERRVPERAADLSSLIDTAEQQLPSPMQEYVTARLEGVAGPSWLDSQTIEQAVRSTEMLGMLVEFGSEAKPSELTSQSWDRAGRAGFAATSAGEEGIRRALQAVQDDFKRKDKKMGRRKVFGATYEWLSSSKLNKEPGDITRIMREHIFETMEVAAGELILGEALPERRLHSVETLASESRLDSRTLRNVLAANGIIPAERKGSTSHVFDAERGRKIAGSVQRLTHVISLGKALNCTRPQADQLLDERLLLPISNGLTAAAGRTRKAVDNEEIARFLSALLGAAKEVELLGSEMVPISKAAEKAKVSSVEIVHLILAGLLEKVCRHGQDEGYAAIHVDPIEVRSQASIWLPGVSAAAAFAKLKLPKSTCWALVDRKDGARLQPLVVRGPTGKHKIYRFDQETVSDFMSEYTTGVRVANASDVGVGVAESRIRKAGIRPILKRSEIGVDLYRVLDIVNLEAA